MTPVAIMGDSNYLTLKQSVMRNNLIFYLLCISLFLISSPGLAQVEGDSIAMYRIETMDGNEFVGEILSETTTEVRLKTSNLGEITISQSDIKRRTTVRSQEFVGDEFWPDNLQSTRYFWAPNGYGLKKGEGYYQNVWVFFNQVSYGFTDNFSVGVGLVPTFLLGGTEVPIWLTPKVSFPIIEDKLQLGAGVLAASILGEGESFGIAYGVATVGDRNKNANLGVGFGYYGNDWGKHPAITFGGMYRISKRGYLITENYILAGSAGVASMGGRVVWPKVALDFGGFAPLGDDVGFLVVLPWLGVSIPFGNY
jgi:hypothetical protein